MKIKNKTKGQIVQWAAILGLDVGAPLIATCAQFPVWVERSAGSTVSGLFVVFALICAIPLFKKGGKILESPSVTLLFGVMLGLFVALRTIVDEMIVICLVGFVSNFAGGAIYKYGEALATKEDK